MTAASRVRSSWEKASRGRPSARGRTGGTLLPMTLRSRCGRPRDVAPPRSPVTTPSSPRARSPALTGAGLAAQWQRLLRCSLPACWIDFSALRKMCPELGNKCLQLRNKSQPPKATTWQFCRDLATYCGAGARRRNSAVTHTHLETPSAIQTSHFAGHSPDLLRSSGALRTVTRVPGNRSSSVLRTAGAP